VVGVAGEDTIDEVRRAWVGQFRVDRRLGVEGRITRR
jgi:hypothetical protein